jgi:hypothetical protein
MCKCICVTKGWKLPEGNLLLWRRRILTLKWIKNLQLFVTIVTRNLHGNNIGNFTSIALFDSDVIYGHPLLGSITLGPPPCHLLQESWVWFDDSKWFSSSGTGNKWVHQSNHKQRIKSTWKFLKIEVQCNIVIFLDKLTKNFVYFLFKNNP